MSPRNFPAGRAVLGGGLLALPPLTKGQPAVGLLIARCFSAKGFSKASFPLRASPPLCHPLWKLSGFGPELSQLPCVLASCCVRLYLGICRAAPPGARAYSDLGRGLRYCQNRVVLDLPSRSCPLPSLCVCSRFPGRGDCTIVSARLAAGLGRVVLVAVTAPWWRISAGSQTCFPATAAEETVAQLISTGAQTQNFSLFFCAFLFIRVLIVRNCYNNLFVSW